VSAIYLNYMDLNKYTIKEASGKLKAGEISSVELTKACLGRIKEVDEKLKACLTVCEVEALDMAKRADERRKNGENGDLLGIPFLAKDNIMTRGIKTTAASRILENYIAPFDATIIKKLKIRGAVLLGKTNLDEFAHGASTENSAFGPTHNPWDLKRVPGGSSGGSAVAVASDMCIFALGTDTGGSIRHPAAYCGVTGLKPSYGRSSRFGLIAMTSSTDVPGPLTKTVEDAGIVMEAISGPDKKDATTIKQDNSFSENEYKQSLKKENIKGTRIGLPMEYFEAGISEDVRKTINEAIQKLKELGAEFIDISLPHTKYAVSVYYIITPAEVSSNLARFDGIRYGFSVEQVETLQELYFKNRGGGFGAEAKRRIILGTYILSSGHFDAYYKQAQKVRIKITEEMIDIFNSVDCLLTPTSPHTAFLLGGQDKDPLKMYLEDVFLAGVSLAGLPAISIPVGFSNNLPIGVQLIGNKFNENKILNIGHHYQMVTDHHLKKPKPLV